jgi:hypothetical protein
MNFDHPLKNLSGEQLLGADKKPLTLRWACTESLLAHYPNQEIDGKEKMDRFRLAHRIEQRGDIDLKIEEVSKLKELVGRYFTPLIVGQVWQLLDPAESK